MEATLNAYAMTAVQGLLGGVCWFSQGVLSPLESDIRELVNDYLGDNAAKAQVNRGLTRWRW